MPNQPSEDSRRITYVEDRQLAEFLQTLAAKRGVTVGELIRQATEAAYRRVTAKKKKTPLATTKTPTTVGRRLSSKKKKTQTHNK